MRYLASSTTHSVQARFIPQKLIFPPEPPLTFSPWFTTIAIAARRFHKQLPAGLTQAGARKCRQVRADAAKRRLH
jgi:hypothetical protein